MSASSSRTEWPTDDCNCKSGAYSSEWESSRWERCSYSANAETSSHWRQPTANDALEWPMPAWQASESAHWIPRSSWSTSEWQCCDGRKPWVRQHPACGGVGAKRSRLQCRIASVDLDTSALSTVRDRSRHSSCQLLTQFQPSSHIEYLLVASGQQWLHPEPTLARFRLQCLLESMLLGSSRVSTDHQHGIN